MFVSHLSSFFEYVFRVRESTQPQLGKWDLIFFMERSYSFWSNRLTWQLRFYLLAFSLILFSQHDLLSQNNQVVSSLRKAEDNFQHGNWTEALKIYQRLVKDHPDSVSAHVGMASSLVKLKDYPPAIIAFHRALEISPRLSRVQGALADTYNKNRQPNEATKWYQKAIESFYGKAPVSWYINLGIIEAQQGNLDQARRYYTVAVQLYSKSVPAYQNLGTVLLRQNRLDEADACFYTALELNPKFDPAFFGRGEIAKKRGKLVVAQRLYETAIRLNSADSAYRYAYAQVLLQSGELEAGKQELKKTRSLKAKSHLQHAHRLAQVKDWQNTLRYLKIAIDADPTLVEAVQDLAYLQTQFDDLKAAESTLSLGLMNQANWASGYWQRGKIREKMSDFIGAESDFRKSIELSPSAAPPKISLAKLLAQTGRDLAQALELAQNAINIDPKPEFQEVIKMIRRKTVSEK